MPFRVINHALPYSKPGRDHFVTCILIDPFVNNVLVYQVESDKGNGRLGFEKAKEFLGIKWGEMLRLDDKNMIIFDEEGSLRYNHHFTFNDVITGKPNLTLSGPALIVQADPQSEDFGSVEIDAGMMLNITFHGDDETLAVAIKEGKAQDKQTMMTAAGPGMEPVGEPTVLWQWEPNPKDEGHILHERERCKRVYHLSDAQLDDVLEYVRVVEKSK